MVKANLGDLARLGVTMLGRILTRLDSCMIGGKMAKIAYPEVIMANIYCSAVETHHSGL